MATRFGSLIEEKVPGAHRLFSAVRLLKCAFDPRIRPFLNFAPPGHYYSPLPTRDAEVAYEILNDPCARQCSGIALNSDKQIALLNEFAAYWSDLPWQEEPNARRYHYGNGWFKAADAVVLACMLRQFSPSTVVEIGSGFSSACMLDVNELFLRGGTTFEFVEPNPERLVALLRADDRERSRIHPSRVQVLPVSFFDVLGAGDVLFVDSSHVAKRGSDVVHLFFNVLPSLRPGVLIHFHDISWPFEFPEHLFRMGIAWNEPYLLRAFLQFNTQFELLSWHSYLASCHKESLATAHPILREQVNSSIWLRRRP